MKNALITGLLLLSLACPAFSDESAPQWSDFVPPDFLNALGPPIPVLKKMPKKTKLGIFALGLVCPPVPIVVFFATQIKKDQIEKDKEDLATLSGYWAGRKRSFDQAVLVCSQQNSSGRTACYKQVTDSENQTNQTLNQLTQRQSGSSLRAQAAAVRQSQTKDL